MITNGPSASQTGRVLGHTIKPRTHRSAKTYRLRAKMRATSLESRTFVSRRIAPMRDSRSRAFFFRFDAPRRTAAVCAPYRKVATSPVHRAKRLQVFRINTQHSTDRVD
jgi:hypothetical protein